MNHRGTGRKLQGASNVLRKVYGAGETAWVRDGQIVATSGFGVNTACFEPNTLALLALP